MPEPIQTSEEDLEIYEMSESEEDIEIYEIDDPNMPDYMKELSDLVNSKPKE